MRINQDQIVDWTEVAKSAYNAYGEARHWVTWNELPMPPWENILPDVKKGWLAAVKDVANTFKVPKVHTESEGT